MAFRGLHIYIVFSTILSYVLVTHSASCKTKEPINDPSDISPDVNITVLPGLVARVGDELNIICVADKPRYVFKEGIAPKPPNRVVAAFDGGKTFKSCPANGGRIECVLTVPLTKTANSVSVICNAANDDGCRTLTLRATILERNIFSATGNTREGNITTTGSSKVPIVDVTKIPASKHMTTEPPKPTTPSDSSAENVTPTMPTICIRPTRNNGELVKPILLYKLTSIWIYTLCTNEKTNFLSVLCGNSFQDRNEGIMTKRRTNKLWSLYASKGKKSKISFSELSICKLMQKACLRARKNTDQVHVKEPIVDVQKHVSRKPGGVKYYQSHVYED